MKSMKLMMMWVLTAAMAAFGEDYDPAKHGNPIRVLEGTVTIDGNGATIDAKGKGRCATLGPNVTLKNFTFRNGAAEIGGGVYGGRIENCIIRGCTASESGAALVNCTAVKCQIVGNGFANGTSTAAAHGGILYGSTLDGCTIVDNAATFGSEAPAFGGIGEQVTIVNCTVEDNTVKAGERVCYGTLYAYSTVDGDEIEFRDLADEEPDPPPVPPTPEDPQPDPGSYTPESDPIIPPLLEGEGMVDRYYERVYIDKLGAFNRAYDKKTTVKAEGLPKGLKLEKVLNGSGSYDYSVIGVPTEAMDGSTRIAYLRITDSQKNVSFRPLKNLIVRPAEVAVFPAGTNGVVYWKFPVSGVWTKYEAGDADWSFSGWPNGIKFAKSALTDRTYGEVAAGRIYGKPTKPGVYTVKAVEKVEGDDGKTYKNTHYATFKIYYDDGEEPVDPTKPAPGFAIDVGDLREADTIRDIRVGVAYSRSITNTAGSTVSQSGLPTGLKLSSVKDKVTKVVTYSVTGVPTKAGYYLTTFTTKLNGVSTIQTVAFRATALPDWAVGTFNGFATNELDKASATLTASSVGKLSGKILLGGKSWSFSASGYTKEIGVAEAFTVEAAAKNGKLLRNLSLLVSEDGAVGRLEDDEDDYDVVLWRNVWKDAGATEMLEDFVGYYTAQLISPTNAYGHGYVTLTIDKKGGCKAGGKLPDGTSISGTLPLVPQGEGLFTIWCQSPSAYKGGYAFGILSLEETDKTVVLRSSSDIDWVNLSPTATGVYGAGFRWTLSAVGAFYDKSTDVTTKLAEACKELVEKDARVKSFSLTKTTGVFTMKMYDPEDSTERKTVSVSGAAVQGGEVVLRGAYLVSEKGEYYDTQDRKKTYSYKDSVPVVVPEPIED